MIKTMNTHESYVSLEVAKLLKEAGFDWEVNSRWQDWCTKDWFLNTDLPYYEDTNGKSNNHGFSAPTIAVAQRWLREVKEMYAEAYLSESHHTPVWIASVYLWENRPLGRELRDKCLCTGIGPVHFDTYEEALEAGIKKCLTLILEKDE